MRPELEPVFELLENLADDAVQSWLEMAADNPKETKPLTKKQ